MSETAIELPEDVVETARITVVVGMAERGNGVWYEYNGLSPEAAEGYLRSVLRRIESESDRRWAPPAADVQDLMDEGFVLGVHLDCPHCGEEIDIEADDDYEDDDE